MIDAIPTVAVVARIAALGDPVIRNLQITQCYHELSAALAERTGLSANRCTFATWASKQAGQTIRKEDLARTLENALDTAPAATQAAGNVAASAQRIGGKRDADEIQEKAIFPYRGWLARLRLFFMRLLGGPTPFDAAIDALVVVARQQARLIITEHMMTIGLSHGRRLRLGEDLSAEFPASLKQLTNPDLRALLERVDPTPDSPRETGAVDWADLPERLHFIVDLFRCYHESRDLFEPPFTPDQIAALKAGRL